MSTHELDRATVSLDDTVTDTVPPRTARPATTADPEAPSAGTALARVLIGAVSLLALLVGVLAIPLGADGLRWVALLVFVVLGVGSAPWQLDATMRLPVRLGFTVVTAVCVGVLLSVAMLDWRAWHPALVASVVAALCVPLHARGIWQGATDLGRRPTAGPRWSRARWGSALESSSAAEAPATTWQRWASPVVAAVGALLCLLAALTHRHLAPRYLGFLPEIGPLWYVGLVLLLVAFALSVLGRARQLAVPTSLTLLVLTVTPAIVYDSPRAQSTYKHVELVEQIRGSGTLSSAVAAYNAWPGLFSSMAWLADVLGTHSVLDMAIVWPPVIAVLRLVVLRFFFGQLLGRPWQAWVAVTLTVLADSIGADYFSPQSLGYVLGIGVFGVALMTGRTLPRLALLLLGGCTLAVTHQLSPFVVGGVLVVLVVFRQVRPWWTPLLVIVPAGGWALLHQSSVSNFLSARLFGRLSNFRPPTTVGSVGLDRLPIVAGATAALLVGIGVLGLLALVALIRDRRDLRAWAMAVSPAVALGLTVVNPYGNEAIFRSVLFGLPWLAALAARLFDPARQVLARVLVVATTVALTAAFLVSSFGLDAFNQTRLGDVAALDYAQSHNPGTYYMLYLGAGTMPTSTARGHLDLGRTQVEVPLRQEADLDAGQQVADITQNYLRYVPPGAQSQISLYALWSPASAEYGRAYGIQTVDQFTALRDAMIDSGYWTVTLQQDGSYLFELDPAQYLASVPR
jgi:hypothetical protein